MSWSVAKDSVTVPSSETRSSPLAVTSYCEAESVTAATASVAATPLTVKSAVPTLRTSSLKDTRQVTLSASVGEADGVWRAIEVTVGAVLSIA